MRQWKAALWLLPILMGLVASGVACSSGSNEGRGQGVVKSIDAEARKVTIDHEEIPGLMGAMTMTFDVAPGVALGDLRDGAEVEFQVVEADGSYIVTEIRRTDS